MIRLDVDFYNQTEEDLFSVYPNFPAIENITNGNLSVRKEDILTYLMFTEQADEDGWRDYNDLKERVQHRLGDVDDMLDLETGSIKAKQSSIRLNNSKMTERIGVSIGLNVVNDIHNLTEADWSITEDQYDNGHRLKDFDYEIPMASDGNRFIQIENKGSVVDDNSYKSSSISQHYNSIKGKKRSILKREEYLNIPRHENIYYGTIASIDTDKVAKVWLVDPPSFEINANANRYKLITRLKFYARLFEDIEVHTRIIDALNDRINELIKTNDITSFDKKPLNNISNRLYTFLRTKQFVKINTNEAFGTFFPFKTQNGIRIFIMATTKRILKLIINQDFTGILNYEYKNADTSEKAIIELSAQLSLKKDQTDQTKIEFILDEKRKRYFAQYYGGIGFTSSGRIFGVIG